jgi:caffeoyl-CoA O-methyltransferase
VSTRTLGLDDRLYEYLLAASLREPPALRRLREETAGHALSRMQISPEQGQFMAWLVETLGVHRILEVGVFTGYSSTVMALALPPDGQLVACDLSEEFTAVARRYWREAGVESRIELRLGPALDTLAALEREGADGTFDLAFVDADKESYLDYYEVCLRLVRVGGVILFDNVLWSGRVADPAESAPTTVAIRALNERAREDQRVAESLVPIGDGLMLLRRRA